MSLIPPSSAIVSATLPAPESLGAQIAAIEAQLHAVSEAKRQHSKAMSGLDSHASQLTKKLATLSEVQAKLRAGVVISDHALVRWLERHYGMDLEPYRQEMANALSQAVAVGASGLKTAHGVFKIRDGVVTTYVKLGSAA
jgi:DNA repair ATPase RecN